MPYETFQAWHVGDLVMHSDLARPYASPRGRRRLRRTCGSLQLGARSYENDCIVP